MSQLRDHQAFDFVRRHKSALRYLAATVLLAVSGIYIYAALAGGLDQLDGFDHSLGMKNIAIILGGVLGTLFLSTMYHAVALRRVQKHSAPLRQVALAYALGQVLRYVPGKVFGIVFQINYLAPRVKGASIAIALLVQTFYDFAWTAILVALVVYCAVQGTALPLLILIPVIALIWLVHHGGHLERLLARPLLLGKFLGESNTAMLRRPGHSSLATVLVVAVWLPMLAGSSLGLSDSFGLHDSLMLSVLYLAAAVLSLLVVVIPSGLVVREALFVWTGTQFGLAPASLVFVGVVLRICLTIAEVLNALIFTAATNLPGRTKPSQDRRGGDDEA